VSGGKLRLPRESEIELALDAAQIEPARRVSIQSLSEFFHRAHANCTTMTDTLSLQVPLRACFISALQAPSGSFPVR